MSLFGRVENARFRVRKALRLGRFPDALILGAAKSGTTSLFSYLAQHPEICTPVHKELRFFDNLWHLGEDWYRAGFTPNSAQRPCVEASPMDLPHPKAPARAHAVVPGSSGRASTGCHVDPR
jgi:hypothetical protein